MKIHNEFSIPLPPEEAWQVLNDIPRVAECVPGAQLVEQKEDGSYLGTVAVRLGPVALSFKGTFAYQDVDEAAHHVRAVAKGNEQKARGSAQANVEFVLSPKGSGTNVAVDTDVELAGSIAQYARGGTLVQSTAQILMNQFAKNLAREFESRPASSAEVSSDDAAAAESGEHNLAKGDKGTRGSRPSASEVSGISLVSQGMWHAVRGSVTKNFGKKK